MKMNKNNALVPLSEQKGCVLLAKQYIVLFSILRNMLDNWPSIKIES